MKHYLAHLTSGDVVDIGAFFSIRSAREYADLEYSTMVVAVTIDPTRVCEAAI